MNINNPTTFSIPDLTLTTSNSSGTAGALRADDSILVYDTTLPDAITFGQSGSAGDTATAARRNHSHAMASETAVPAATQAEMEAGSSTTVFVTPGREQYHPGSGKVWCHWETVSSTSILSSYNVGSLTDGGTGITTINYTVDFSGADAYAVTGMSSVGGTNSFSPPAADSVRINTFSDSGSTYVDSADNSVICMGDQ